MSNSYWLFIVLTLALTAFIGYGTYSTARLLQTWTPDRNLILMPAENVVRFVLLAGCIGLGLLSGLDNATLGWTFGRPLFQVLNGLLWGLGLAAFFYWSTRWFITQTDQRFYSTVVIEAILPRTSTELLWVTLAMLPVVILEEVLFRSLLLGGLSPVVPSLLLLIITGLLFGLLHSPQGVWGMVGAGAAGVIFGVLFWAYGSILTPIVAHYVANMVQIGYAMRLRERGEFKQKAARLI